MSQPAHPLLRALYAWPPQAAVGRVLPKSKIYAHTKASAATRALFVAQVEQITWAYKLAPETINLPATPAVPEIEVFELALKSPEFNHAVLRSIDKAIAFPILFELRFEGRAQLVAAYKRPSEADASQWVVGDYFAAPWQLDSGARPGLPLSLDLRGLYEQLLRTLMPLPPRAGENLVSQLARISQWRSGHSELTRLQTQLRQEKQFNRKVALNAELRKLQKSVDNFAS